MRRLLSMIMSLFILTPVPAFAVTANPDAETLGLIQAINQQEIKAAEAAKQKQDIDSKVSDYAKMMEKEHNKNWDKCQEIAKKTGIQPAESDAVVSQRAKGVDEVAKLSALQGKEFASAYIQAMVQGHQDALSILDKQSSQVQNKDLQKYVSETRDHVQHHLEKAQQIQSELQKPQ